MKKPDLCRECAAEILRLAETATDAATKERLIAIATKWHEFASTLEKLDDGLAISPSPNGGRTLSPPRGQISSGGLLDPQSGSRAHRDLIVHLQGLHKRGHARQQARRCIEPLW